MTKKAKIAVEWLLRSYLPSCLDLAGRTRAADVLRSLEPGASLDERGRYMREKLLPHLGLREPVDIMGFIAKSGGDPLYDKVEQAIRSEADAERRWTLLVGAGKAWYAAADAIADAADAVEGANEAEQSAFGAKIDALYAHLARELDAGLAACSAVRTSI